MGVIDIAVSRGETVGCQDGIPDLLLAERED
jgi:hypothetical protein